MKLQKLFDDEDAVSPVIGVILMVAITVILAAVIGTFVLGLGEQVQNTTPQVTFGFTYDASTKTATITHKGGDTLNSGNSQKVEIDGSATSASTWSLSISAGSSTTYSYTNAGETIRVIWYSPSSDKTAVIGQSTAPS